MGETHKAHHRRMVEGWYRKYIGLPGIDVGCQHDPINNSFRKWDIIFGDGDATYMAGVKDDTYQTVYCSHILEHLNDTIGAIHNWYRILRPGGYLIICVPHRELYEKKDQPPSRWNPEHKSFWLPEKGAGQGCHGLLETIRVAIPHAKVVDLRVLSDGYRGFAPEMHSTGEYAIECVVQKPRQSDVHDCELSVGIVTYNQKDHCVNLVRQMLDTIPGNSVIFVYDNNSAMPIHLPVDSRIRYIQGQSNDGYITPNNKMARMSRSRYHLVSNDDVVVSPGWYNAMLREFADPAIGCVGGWPQFGTLTDEFGGLPTPLSREPEYVEGWYMMFPRHVVDLYGPFDETNLKVATCEDSHVSLSLREMGWRIKCLRDLSVTHLGSLTKKTSRDLDNFFTSSRNVPWLRQRWKGYLCKRTFFNQ